MNQIDSNRWRIRTHQSRLAAKPLEKRSISLPLRTRPTLRNMEGATIRAPPAAPMARGSTAGESAAPPPAATFPTARRQDCSSRTRTPSIGGGRRRGRRRRRAGALPRRQNRKAATGSIFRRRGRTGTRMTKINRIVYYVFSFKILVVCCTNIFTVGFLASVVLLIIHQNLN